ncbi:hypothetical protein AKJ09_06410 [Labilithrix luteola]|uniref:NmrA-like domain-containing protein n=1 Tax=Labilithrix luteola TaxID=1391654 RepID=A0A0K1Q281_9BACT|nr:NmrA/HSCARG family protein [Labilithrix luteola]AKU99746.1 hypothetical protein AKJ09_06410 [Labilithrix luteola]
MANEGTILVTGATGKQGGATARHLLERGFRVRARTRNPEGEAAQQLKQKGAELVAGDFDDAASLERALDGAWGAFAVQPLERGPAVEIVNGERFGRMARQKGVTHLVYSSVGSAHRNTGIPHFESKWTTEQTLRGLGFPRLTILRPVYFMENLLSPWTLRGDQLVSWISPDRELQMIAVDDIGKFGALAFARSEQLAGAAIDIAGDSVTMTQAASILSSARGRPVTLVRQSIDEIRKTSEDLASMAEWFERVGYDADMPALKRTYDVPLLTLADWARTAFGGEGVAA